MTTPGNDSTKGSPMKRLSNLAHRGMRRLNQERLFPAIAAYEAICLRTVIAANGVDDDGIDKITHSEEWMNEHICRKEQTWSMARVMGPGWGDSVPIEAYYAKDGSFIGDRKTAHYLIARDIAPMRSHPDHRVASIGFSERNQVWWGWSHRAMAKFGVGDVFYRAGQAAPYGNGDNADPEDETRLIATLDEAKQCAIAFADDVS